MGFWDWFKSEGKKIEPMISVDLKHREILKFLTKETITYIAEDLKNNKFEAKFLGDKGIIPIDSNQIEKDNRIRENLKDFFKNFNESPKFLSQEDINNYEKEILTLFVEWLHLELYYLRFKDKILQEDSIPAIKRIITGIALLPDKNAKKIFKIYGYIYPK